MLTVDVLVIGGGPAGLAAAIAAHQNGAQVLLIEREARLGGILKQCIHDGFGLVRYGEKLSGPEYAGRFIDEFHALGLQARTLTFVTRIQKTVEGFAVTLVNRDGVETVAAKALVLATGCRERTAKQVSIHGTRPAGVFTAGCAQHFTNLLGQLPTRKCVILGSGDIGLIMARRLTLEGAQVLGVYEAKPTPSGLTRNIHQCLHDYNIPLYLSHTVTRVFGQDRLTAVEISQVDECMVPIPGTEQIVECDALILSVGLIPENELAEGLGAAIDPKTKGPICDAGLMTSVPVSFPAAMPCMSMTWWTMSPKAEKPQEKARPGTVRGSKEPSFPSWRGEGLLYAVPQRLDVAADRSAVTVYFRSRENLGPCRLVITADGREIYTRRYPFLRPPEMERLELDLSAQALTAASQIKLEIEVMEHD